MTVRKKHKKILARAKGFRHGRKNLIKLARQADTRAGQYAYRDRRAKKRDFRRLWITQINAACKLNEIKYSLFIKGLRNKKIDLDRKVLAQIAIKEPETFSKIVKKIKT